MSCVPSTATTFPVPWTPASAGAAPRFSRCLTQHGINAPRHAPPPAPQVAELAPGPKPLLERALTPDWAKLRPARTDAEILVARRRKAFSLPLPAIACASAFSNGTIHPTGLMCALTLSVIRRVPHGLENLPQEHSLGKAQPIFLYSYATISRHGRGSGLRRGQHHTTVPVKVLQVRPSSASGSSVQQHLS